MGFNDRTLRWSEQASAMIGARHCVLGGALAGAARGDFLFGAVIVRDGDVRWRQAVPGRTTNDPTAHGEMAAIRRFVAVRPPPSSGHDPLPRANLVPCA
jgi:tRNA(Arg) A34 adenosine deaminase TadA